MMKRLNLIFILTVLSICFNTYSISLNAQVGWYEPPLITQADCNADNGKIAYSKIRNLKDSYSWSTGETGSSIANLAPGYYYVTINVSDGQFYIRDTIEVKRSDSPETTDKKINEDFITNMHAKLDEESLITAYRVGDSIELRKQPLLISSEDSLICTIKTEYCYNFKYHAASHRFITVTSPTTDQYQLQQWDFSGNLLWDVDINSSSLFRLSDMIIMDNSIFVLGRTNEPFFSDEVSLGNCIVYKFDLEGNNLWSQVYGGTNYENVYRIDTLDNGHLFIDGYSSSNDYDLEGHTSSNHGSWLLEIDADGDVINSRKYNSSLFRGSNAVTILPDGRKILVGVGNTDGLGPVDGTDALFWVAEVFDDLQIKSIKPLSRHWRPTGRVKVFPHRNGFIISGNLRMWGQEYMVVSFVDENLELQWEHRIEFCESRYTEFYTFGDIIVAAGGHCYSPLIFTRKGLIQIEHTSAQIPALNFENQTAICDSTSISLDIMGDDMAFQWDTGDTTAHVTFDNEGLYSVSVTNGDGCMFSDSFNLDFIENPIVLDLGNDTSQCNILNLDAENEGMQYFWQDYSINQTYQTAESGTYYVRVVSEEGCVALDTIQFDFESTITNELDAIGSLCNDLPQGSISLINNIDPNLYEYQWSNDSVGIAIQDLMEGTYYLTITELSTSCQAVDTIQLEDQIQESISIELINAHVDCFGDLTSVTASASGGVGPYSYIWNESTESSDATLLAGFYPLEITDAIGCNFTEVVEITESLEIYLDSISIGHPTGSNSDGFIHLRILGGTPIIAGSQKFYSLFLDDQPLTYISIFDNLPAGSHDLIVEDAKGCQKLFRFDLTPNATTQTTLPSQSILLSPNPTTQITTIQLVDPSLIIEQVTLLNQVGQQQRVDYNLAQHTLSLGVLPSGIYMVYVKTNKGVAVEKLMKL